MPYRRSIRYSRFIAPGRALGAFPQKKTVALRYIDDLTLNAGSSTIASDIYRVNSVYDPYYSTGGHQPMFHDLYSQIYEKYHVNYATIKLVCLSNHIVNTTYGTQTEGTTTGDQQFYAANERACRMFILKDTSVNDIPTALNTLIEEGSRNFRWRYVPQNLSGKMSSVKMSCNPAKQLLLSKYDDQLNSVVNNNPTAEAYFIVGCEGLGGGINPDSLKFQVIITYNVTYYELKKNQSQN